MTSPWDNIKDTSSPSKPAKVKAVGNISSLGWMVLKPTGGLVATFCFKSDAENLAEALYDYVEYV